MATATRSIEGPGIASREPLSFRIYGLSPLGTAVTGLLFGVTTIGVLAITEFLTERPLQLMDGVPPEQVGCFYLVGDYRIAIIGIILLAYTTSARRVLSQWAVDVSDSLAGKDQRFVEAEAMAQQSAWGFVPGILGSAICLAFAVDIAEREIEWTSDYWILPHAFNWLWCIPFGWVGGRFFYSIGMNAILISRLTTAVRVRDLYHTEPLELAIQYGSRTALLSLIFLGLVSVHFVDPGLGYVAVAVLVVLFLVGVLIATVPAFGSMAKLHDARDRQIEKLREQLAREEKGLTEYQPDYVPGRISDIVALEKRLEEWQVNPFGFSNIARLVLFAIVGFLSWLGAAAVSVVVENLLGL